MNKYLIMALGSLGILSLFATAFFPMLNFTIHFSEDKAAIIPYQGAILLTALSGFFSLSCKTERMLSATFSPRKIEAS